jgi:cytoskeletal protein RodZ
MKIGIILGIIIGAIIAALAIMIIIVLVVLPMAREVNTPDTSSPAITSTIASSTTPKPASSTTAPTSTSTAPKPTGTSPASPNANVNFNLIVTGVNTDILSASATIASQVSNTGTADAHNAWAKVEVFQQGNRIQVGGQDYFRYDIGTLKAGETRDVQVTIKFGIMDALKVLQSGATLNLTLTSDEKTQTMSYDYVP